ncbi:MAG: energy-converting hydrogenase B subunit P [Methanobrevibacter sp.]|jgi:energy-converting hydrogenase B subunit P|nr:energy-converting hydrogenase B subunit P [Candidatus Methanovirga aequatorialis]
MKFVVRDRHIVSLGGYIVERNFPYRNLIVVNKSAESVKVEIPIFEEEWIEEHRNLGLDIISVSEEDNFLTLFKKAKKELENVKNES